MRIKQRLTDAFRLHGVLEHRLLERRIPAEQWTQKGDVFSFDFGYRPTQVAGKPNGHIKLIHALSLSRDEDTANRLANTIRYVRRKEPAELTAVVGALPAAGDERASYCERILLDAEVRLQPLAGIDTYAQSVRAELFT